MSSAFLVSRNFSINSFRTLGDDILVRAQILSNVPSYINISPHDARGMFSSLKK
jgi:hypothetical protein